MRETVRETVSPTDADQVEVCLELQRARVETQLERLEASDAHAVTAAVASAASSSDPASCLDGAKLAQAAWPSDARRQDVLELRRRSLGLVQAADAGDVGAIEVARQVLHEAQKLGFEPLVAEARVTLGTVVRVRDHVEAEALLRAGYFDAIRLNSPALAAEAALRLEGVVVAGAGRIGEGLEWARHAQTWIDRLDESDGLLGARLANARGLTYRAKGNFVEAHEQHRAALAIEETVLGATHPDVAYSLHNVGIVLAEQGDHAAAQQRFERALEIVTTVFGPHHPRVAGALTSIANTRRLQGDLRGSAKLHREALRLREAAFGAEHVLVADSLQNLAFVEARLDAQEGVKHFTRCLEIRERVLGADHPDTLNALQSLGGALARVGRDEEARERLYDAVTRREALHGTDHPDVAYGRHALGAALFRMKRYREAIPHLEQALTVLEPTWGRDSGRLAVVLHALGGSYFGNDQFDDAERIFRRSLILVVAARGEQNTLAIEIYQYLASIASNKNRPYEALQTLDHILAIPDLAKHSPQKAAEVTKHRTKLVTQLGAQRFG